MPEGTPQRTFTVNAFGQVASMTDENGNTTQFVYDVNGYLDRVTRAYGTPLAATTELDPDPLGRPTVLRDPRGNTTSLVYNAWDKLEMSFAPAPFGYLTQLHYDADGNLAQIDRQSELAGNPQTTTLTYTVFDQLQTITNELGETTAFAYDGNRNRTLVRDPELNTTTTIFDERALPYQTTDAENRVTRLNYHPTAPSPRSPTATATPRATPPTTSITSRPSPTPTPPPSTSATPTRTSCARPPAHSRCTMGARELRMSQRVTLTFDNGPTPVTAQVLDVLAARRVRATFFVVGKQLRRPGARALAERALAEGHRIGNHSLTHSTPLGVRDDPDEALREIDEMQALLGDLVPGERFFRPFGGGGIIDRNLLGRRALERLVRGEYTCVLWNSVPRDWEDPAHWPETCLADVARRPWSVVVLHDLPTGAMERLPEFLDALGARGIEVVHEFQDDCVPLRCGRATPAFETLEWLAAE